MTCLVNTAANYLGRRGKKTLFLFESDLILYHSLSDCEQRRRSIQTALKADK